ncbi:hypothetical protein GCM10025734_19880 [Kitasatospora paranensis]
MEQQVSEGTDRRILDRIGEMVEAERVLREQLAAGRIDPEVEQQRLHELEAELDQCWDLLRQRRARADAGEDPNLAAVRSVEDVERYES